MEGNLSRVRRSLRDVFAHVRALPNALSQAVRFDIVRETIDFIVDSISFD